MRHAGSYRGAKRNAVRAARKDQLEHKRRSQWVGEPMDRFEMKEDGAYEARKKLAQWAANGAQVTDEEVADANARAKKITADDVDAALEKALTHWQHELMRTDPMALSPIFAARARSLGWAEGVEFVEEPYGRRQDV